MSQDGQLTEFPVSEHAWRGVSDLVDGPNGSIWFLERSENKIGTIDRDGILHEYAIPTPSSYPRHLVAGPDGNLWFTEYDAGKIGRITPRGSIVEFDVPE